MRIIVTSLKSPPIYVPLWVDYLVRCVVDAGRLEHDRSLEPCPRCGSKPLLGQCPHCCEDPDCEVCS